MECSWTRIPGIAVALVLLSSTAVAQDETGTLIVTVSVPGASVMVDGELRGESPLDPLGDVPAGVHRVEVQADGYRPFDTEFTLEAGQTKEIRAFLNAAKGAKLSVASITEGARVYVDDFDVGTVPLPEPLVLTSGTHEIKVTKLGFMAYSETVELKKGEKKDIQADLLAFAGILDIRSTVPKAEVLIDDKPVGTTPLEIEAFAGQHAIVVRKEGHTSHEVTLTIAAGAAYSVQAELEPIPSESPEPVGETGTGEETILATEEHEPLVAPPPAQPGAEPVDEGKAWYKQWWLWTAVAVVVGVAIAVPIAVDASSSSSGGTSLPETDVPDIHLP